MNKELADIIYPEINMTIGEYEKKYPKRYLGDDVIVTRYAPSPTGFIHIGGLLTSFVSTIFAKKTTGIIYLRIEDTDTERTIENGISVIINGLKNFNITFDEAPINDTENIGEYGPYIQSKRAKIYKTFVKDLLNRGLAYPCFCEKDKIDNIRKKQSQEKSRIGYYGEWASCRNLSTQEAISKIQNGKDYIMRLKSPGNFNNKIKYNDLVRGTIELPENDMDIVIMKSDGLPTYHFAHLVDDYLMRSSHIIRADEWLSSIPIHLQLFEVFGFPTPKYAHISPLLKKENEVLRKLSKRKDPESSMDYYAEKGMPSEAVMIYLATIINSDFEEWYINNKDKSIYDFNFEFSKMNKSGAIFDTAKLNDISKEYISRMSATTLYDNILRYLIRNDIEFFEIFNKNPNFSVAMLNIDREKENPRKDLSCYQDVKNEFRFMYDEYFDNETIDFSEILINNKEEINNIIGTYLEKYYNESDDKELWFQKIKDLCNELGYASNMKDFKLKPNDYKGNISDVSTLLRVALTNRTKTPDLFELMKLLGKDRVIKRFFQAGKFLEQ